MKHTLITLAAAALLAPAANAQTYKFGHIDRAELMHMLPERDSAEKRMQDFAHKLDDKLKAMGAEFQGRLQEYEAKKASMTKTEQDMEETELKDMQDRLIKAQSKAEDDLAKQEEELLAPMVKRTDDAIKAVGAEKNFTYIFDTSTGMVLYWDKGEDILPLVKAKLGIQ